MLYTSAVEPGHLSADGDGIAATAHLFQERVRARHAVRLTVVDGRMFAASVTSTSAEPLLDWRAEQDRLEYEQVTVPGDVASGVRALTAALRLRFAALDFLVRPDGSWDCVDVNPNGQWAWIQEATGMPISGALADALTGAGEEA